MNERYLFRGKRKDNGKWVEGFLYIIERDSLCETETYKAGDEE